jgi:RNA-binding protein 5/10
MNSQKEAQDFLKSILKPPKEHKVDQLEIAQENECILVRGIPFSATKDQIETALIDTKAAFETVKLIKNNQGLSRGFAFVTFFTKELARNWLARNQKEIMILGIICSCEYSFQQEKDDWECIHCGGVNFKRRDECYRCGIPKNYNQAIDIVVNSGSRDIGTVPSRFLLVRGFPAECEPRDIFELANLNCTRFYVTKKRDTKISHCFGFAEYPTEEEAIEMINCLHQSKNRKKIEIYGKSVTVTFAHLGSFLTAKPDSVYISFSSLENGHLVYKRYWDESCYCEAFPALDFDVITPDQLPNPKTTTKASKSSTINAKKFNAQFQKWHDTQKHFDIAGLSLPVLFERVPSAAQVSAKLCDFEKLTCLLCQRRFELPHLLQNHVDMSMMHKQQVKFYRKRKLDKLVEIETNIANEKAVYEEQQQEQKTFQPTKFGIRSDNVGNQILQKMGWKQGQGLGIESNGIRKVIKIEKRRRGAGLGTDASIKRFKRT